MKQVFALFSFLILLAPSLAQAQAPAIPAAPAVPSPPPAPAPQTATQAAAPPADASSMPDGEIVKDPVCFNVINQAPYTVYGTFTTNNYTASDGGQARHRANFRLGEKQETQFCTYGPFYAGRKLDLTLRTLVPVFSCRTAVTGDIVVNGKRNPEGGTSTWAVCLQ